tara:strand:+ start:7819 stop:9030 length:1212 start_codon:yes stop_codon:yes gene_type:complete
MNSTIIFNPFLTSYKHNPYDQFAKIREVQSMQYSEALQAWVVFGYKESKEILLNNKIFSSSVLTASGQIADLIKSQQLNSPIGFTETVINSDEPTHTRLRSLVHRAFLPNKISELENYVNFIVDEIIQSCKEKGSIEIMSDFAQPVPIKVISKMLGIPPADYKVFKGWSDSIIQAATNILPNQQIIDQGNVAVTELIEYLNHQLNIRKNKQDVEDILDELIQAEEDGEILSDKELIAFVILLLVAGNETTTNFVGNSIASLVNDNSSLNQMIDKKIKMNVAIEELFRVNSPVIGVARFANNDFSIDQMQIKKGQAVLIMVGSANYDPAFFDQPNSIDFNRKFKQHLSFGHGIHYCLGSSLARMESSVMFEKILPLVDKKNLIEEIQFDSTFFLRWPKSMQFKL